MGGNHQIWNKDAFNGGEPKLIGIHAKSGARTISGGFLLSSLCLFGKTEMSNLSIFVSYTIERPREDEKNETFPDSEGFICKEKLDLQICIGWICTVFHGVFLISTSSASIMSGALYSSSFCSFLNKNSLLFELLIL